MTNGKICSRCNEPNATDAERCTSCSWSWPLFVYVTQTVDGKAHTLEHYEPVLRIGSAAGVHVFVPGDGVSPRHTELRIGGGLVRLVDVGSETGTYLDGVRITAALLPKSSMVQLGSDGPELQVTWEELPPYRVAFSCRVCGHVRKLPTDPALTYNSHDDMCVHEAAELTHIEGFLPVKPKLRLVATDVRVRSATKEPRMKSCPFCAEQIQDAAIKCRHCGEFLDNEGAAFPAAPSVPPLADTANREAPSEPVSLPALADGVSALEVPSATVADDGMAVATPDAKAASIIKGYTWGAAGAMFAIPLPGADMAATFAVWAKMIMEIGRAYGYEASADDAKRLASDLFKGAVLTSVAWFASAKVASNLLKFIPGAGTVTAYVVDAAIAAFGAKKITAAVGLAAAAYYKSGKTLAPKDLKEHIKNVIKAPEMLLQILGAIVPGAPEEGPSDSTPDAP